MLYYVTPLLPGEHKSKEKPEGTWKCPPAPKDQFPLDGKP